MSELSTTQGITPFLWYNGQAEEAMNLYEKVAGASADPDQKKVFTELAKMERGHKARLEDIYTNSAFAEAW